MAILGSVTSRVSHLGRLVGSERRRSSIVALILGGVVASMGAGDLDMHLKAYAERVGKATGVVIDFATQDPDLLIAGDGANESLGADLAMGDLDGDDVDDLVIGAPWAHRAGDERFAGHVYIFFGGGDRPASLRGDDADVTIVGAAANGAIGGGLLRQPGTIAIGDVNNDAFDDLILSAPEAQGWAGEVRVLFGRSRTDWEATPTVDLAAVSGDIVIAGADANDALGSAVAVGDVNGDDIGDLIVGAPRADGFGNDRTDAGEVYIFLGRNSWPGTLLAEDDADVRVIGAQKRDALGSGLAVGELGGPTTEVVTTGVITDVAIGARGGAGPDDDRGMAGEVHVLFGSADLAGTRDLSTAPADWIIYAADSIDDIGRCLVVGDVSGDGQPDLVIGVPGGDGPANGREDAGEVAVLFGPRTSGATSDLANGGDFVVYGPQGGTNQRPGGRLGDNLALGNFNGDGVLDVLAGARQGDGFNDARPNTGEAYVIFGGELSPSLDLSTGGADIAVYGRNSGDFLGRVAAGDVDRVAPDDLALGAHRASVTDGDTLDGAGEVFVIYQQAAEPTRTPTLSPTSTVTTTPGAATPTPTTVTPMTFNYLPLVLRD